MIFWIIIPGLTILALAFVVVPLARDYQATSASPLRPQHVASLILGLATVIVVLAVGMYAFVGRPDLATVEARVDAISRAPTSENSTPASSMTDMIAQLQEKVRQNPKAVDGWQTLGWAFMHIHQPQNAADAYRHAVSLAPDNSEYHSGLAEAMIQSGDGKISAEALAELKRVTAPSDARAQFYLALYKDQQGDHRGAIADWIGLLKSAPAGAAWAPEVRRVVEQVAKEEKLDVSAQLPAVSSPSPDARVTGPSGEQMAAAAQMPADDRNAMIHTMVDRLAGQLKQNPHDADGWVRLMRARMVLGERDQALAAYRAARSAFAKEPAQLTTLENQARALGVAGG